MDPLQLYSLEQISFMQYTQQLCSIAKAWHDIMQEAWWLCHNTTNEFAEVVVTDSIV